VANNDTLTQLYGLRRGLSYFLTIVEPSSEQALLAAAIDAPQATR
jgi:hypothetical protein